MAHSSPRQGAEEGEGPGGRGRHIRGRRPAGGGKSERASEGSRPVWHRPPPPGSCSCSAALPPESSAERERRGPEEAEGGRWMLPL